MTLTLVRPATLLAALAVLRLVSDFTRLAGALVSSTSAPVFGSEYEPNVYLVPFFATYFAMRSCTVARAALEALVATGAFAARAAL